MIQLVLWVVHVMSTERPILGANFLLSHESNYSKKVTAILHIGMQNSDYDLAIEGPKTLLL